MQPAPHGSHRYLQGRGGFRTGHALEFHHDKGKAPVVRELGDGGPYQRVIFLRKQGLFGTGGGGLRSPTHGVHQIAQTGQGATTTPE